MEEKTKSKDIIEDTGISLFAALPLSDSFIMTYIRYVVIKTYMVGIRKQE